MSQPNQTFQRLYRWRDLPAAVRLSIAEIERLIKAGKFPRPIPLTDGGRAVAWLEHDLTQWQAERIAARDAAERKATRDAERIKARDAAAGNADRDSDRIAAEGGAK